MRKYINRLNAIVLGALLLFLTVGVSNSYGQCDLKAEYKVEQEASGNATILIKLEKGNGLIKFYLVDLNKPQAGPVQQNQKTAQELKSEFVEIFKNVPQSNYIIQAVSNNDCQVSIGGLEGISTSSKLEIER
jgi:hypothetical protein